MSPGRSEVVVVLEPGDGAVDTLLEVGAGFETGGGGELGLTLGTHGIIREIVIGEAYAVAELGGVG